MRILFIHPDCNRPYHGRTHLQEPLGGTEATVIRVAEGLSSRGHCVTVMQGGRTETEVTANRVRYMPLEVKPERTPDYQQVIVIDTEKLLPTIRQYYQPHSLYLWMHCFPGKKRRKNLGEYLARSEATILSVSSTHRAVLMRHLIRYGETGKHSPERVRVIYNPVSDHLVPDQTPVDEDMLVFLSSPHKGLPQVLDHFNRLRQELPSLKLYVADPGYMKGYGVNELPENVYRIGSVPHPRVMEIIRSSYCLFYPQSGFAETFGLVFAESLAVGTPVLAHPAGAAAEVIENEEMLINADDHQTIRNTFLRWKENGRPVARLSEKFRLSSVLDAWEQTINQDPAPADLAGVEQIH